MSWSFNAIGKPEDFPKALDAESDRLTGQSKEEFDAAKPHLLGLIALNTDKSVPRLMQLTAGGHATKANGETTSSHCSVELKPAPFRLLGC